MVAQNALAMGSSAARTPAKPKVRVGVLAFLERALCPTNLVCGFEAPHSLPHVS